jgi:para-aminobenzoate synthetase component I
MGMASVNRLALEPILPWYWRSLPLAGRTGTQVFEALFLNPQVPSDSPERAISTLLESPYPTPTPIPESRYSLCAGAPRWIDNRPQLWTPSIGEILPGLRQLLQRPKPDPAQFIPALTPTEATHYATLPFTGGWLGWLGYDLAWEIENLPHLNSDTLPFPVAYWYEPADFAILDHHQQQLWIASSDRHGLDRLQQQLETASPSDQNSKILPQPEDSLPPFPQVLLSQFDYEERVKKAKKYIQAGDIFQANLSLRFETTTPQESWDVYQTLRGINPSPFASYWRSPWGDVVSCSPERLVQLQGQTAQTRPIAGTRARGKTPEQDQQLGTELLGNRKERAEHIMLVDLERNDLGRVCDWGTVEVNELLTIERYSHVMHLVSNVRGTLQGDRDSIDLIRATFPGGTITGCPKVRCMEIIEELEPVRRSLFYGSCGYLDQRGQLDLNILIRTLLFAPDPWATTESKEKTYRVWGQVGAGIVADSEPEKEWYESLDKARAQLAALHRAIAHPGEPNPEGNRRVPL